MPASGSGTRSRAKFEDGIIYGLGAGDEKCSTPPMIYAMAALKKLGLAKDWTLYYFGNMEEWCDGISGNALVEHEGIRPEFCGDGRIDRDGDLSRPSWANRDQRHL